MQSVLDIYAEGRRYFMGEALLNNALAAQPDRLKDLADVQELIKVRRTSNDFTERLDPYVREKYLELSKSVKSGSNNVFEEQ
jgi:hypothetical protein